MTPSRLQFAGPDRWQRLGLRTQLALVFGSLVLLLGILMSLGFAELLRVRTEREAGASLHSVATNASRLLADDLHSKARTVQVLVSSTSLWEQGLAAPGVTALLSRLRAVQPHSTWIGVADTKGTVLSATNDLLVGSDVSSRPWFKNGLNSIYVGDMHPVVRLADLLPPLPNGEPYRVMDFSAPIQLRGKTIGVLGIQSSWAWTGEAVEMLLPSNAQEQQISLFIFDKNGQMIYAPGGQIKPFIDAGQELPFAPRMAEVDSQQLRPSPRIVQWKDGGKEFLTTIVPLQPRSAATDLGWYIVARQPLQTAYAQARQAMYQVLATGLVAAVLAAVMAWWAARHLSQDIKRLASAARAIHDGDQGAEIPLTHSSREISHLSRMLHSSIAKLKASHDAMEAQVAERTLQLQKANAELELLAHSDPLTGLLNRRGFDARMLYALALAKRGNRPLSLLAMDIDHFKSVNDVFGHEVGDMVLQCVAQVLKSRLRVSDVLARMGGEEFIALLPDTSLDTAMELAEELRTRMESAPMPHGQQVTLSIGVSCLSDTDMEASGLLRRSDEALYNAKAAGRNNVQPLPPPPPV
ncbi:MAG: diguanylate cyclase [Comamonas sp.]|uniref:sensor domain-containing diguanylate cyclase n=1 Tax=Comamonas sp. TaxID=34028 RepID=UPI00302C166B